jgi:thioredoxin-like negative regulator of GroEL
VTSLTLAAILQLPFLASNPETYADAHRKTVETGQPMVVMVGADWCPACQQMEKNILPQIRQHGLLRRVCYAHVNLDHEQELGRQLTNGGPIPQLIVFRKTADGWHRRQLIGGQSVQTGEELLSDEIAQSQAPQNTTAQAQKKAEPQPVHGRPTELSADNASPEKIRAATAQ